MRAPGEEVQWWGLCKYGGDEHTLKDETDTGRGPLKHYVRWGSLNAG